MNKVFGLQALAERLHCSVSTVFKWKKAGKLDGCYCRIGHKIIFDMDKIEDKFTVR